MTDIPPPVLDGSQLLAAATETLTRGGYQQVKSRGPSGALTRLMEDEYGVVGVAIFDSWDQLKAAWPTCQGELVDAISSQVSRSDPKAWEGYLVLLSVGSASADDAAAVNELRYDTNRLRKIVATGNDIISVKDVETALLPLLPLQVEVEEPDGFGVLERLPSILVNHGIAEAVAEVAIQAFTDNESILERLYVSGAVE